MPPKNPTRSLLRFLISTRAEIETTRLITTMTKTSSPVAKNLVWQFKTPITQVATVARLARLQGHEAPTILFSRFSDMHTKTEDVRGGESDDEDAPRPKEALFF